MAKSEATKLVTVETNGSIAELGGVAGPILNPCYLPVSTVIRMINNHRKIYEVNPADYSDKVRLNLKNLNIEKFKRTVAVTARTTTTRTLNLDGDFAKK